jgi:hypothetical protein
MSEEEVACRLRGSVAWRRARMGLLGEEVREGLTEALRPVWARVRRRTQPLARRAERMWARLWF